MHTPARFHRLLTAAFRTPAARTIRTRPRVLGPIEHLEDRLVPASVVVTSTSDAVNGDTTNITALIATPGADGISLREAIAAANNTAGADAITFDPALAGQTITLSAVGDGTAGPSALAITSPITIEGPSGANGVTLAGRGANSNLRAFYVGSTGDLTLRTLTVRDFRHQGGGSLAGGGAAGLGGRRSSIAEV